MVEHTLDRLFHVNCGSIVFTDLNHRIGYSYSYIPPFIFIITYPNISAGLTNPL